MSEEKTTVTMRQAARYYNRGYLKQSKFAWMTGPVWMICIVLNRLAPSLIVAQILNKLQAGDTETGDLMGLLGIAVGSVLIGEIITRFCLHYLSYFQVWQSESILIDSYNNLMDKSLGFHADNFAGSLTTKINRLGRNSISFNDTIHFNILDPLAVILFTVVVLGPSNPIAVILGLSLLVAYCVAVMPFIKKRIKMVEKRAAMESKRTGLLVDGITNVLTVKSFAKEGDEEKIFANHVRKTGQQTINTWIYDVWKVHPISVLFYIVIVFVPLAVTIQAGSSGADIGELFLTYTLFSIIGSKIFEFARTWKNIETQLAEAVEGLEIINQEPGVKDIEGAKGLAVEEAGIDFKGVEFSYNNIELFKDFDLTIPHAQKVGLVGPSGGGKSTFVKLILRFMDVTDGSLNIDGQDISKITQKSLRENISYIPQEPLLFHRSIYDNIKYGNPDATKKQVVAASKKAHAHEFIETLPKGYDTLVGERGIKLSGGQRQRVAIARAFLKDAPILVLDEATSALDSESEVLIQESLLKLMQNRTTVVIAHRLSTVKHLDRIIVLGNGEIVQDGTHDELSAREGLYKTLWSHQSGGFLQD